VPRGLVLDNERTLAGEDGGWVNPQRLLFRGPAPLSFRDFFLVGPSFWRFISDVEIACSLAVKKKQASFRILAASVKP
jgi:hypothetical protein